jgi:6-pyruvoyl-tetrahydropterin synthase
MFKKSFVCIKINLRKLITNYIHKINYFSYKSKTLVQLQKKNNPKKGFTPDIGKIAVKYEDYINTLDSKYFEALSELEKKPAKFDFKNATNVVIQEGIWATLSKNATNAASVVILSVAGQYIGYKLFSGAPVVDPKADRLREEREKRKFENEQARREEQSKKHKVNSERSQAEILKNNSKSAYYEAKRIKLERDGTTSKKDTGALLGLICMDTPIPPSFVALIVLYACYLSAEVL